MLRKHKCSHKVFGWIDCSSMAGRDAVVGEAYTPLFIFRMEF